MSAKLIPAKLIPAKLIFSTQVACVAVALGGIMQAHVDLAVGLDVTIAME